MLEDNYAEGRKRTCLATRAVRELASGTAAKPPKFPWPLPP